MVTRLLFKKKQKMRERRRDEDNSDGRGSEGFWDVSGETGANGGFGDGAAGTGLNKEEERICPGRG